MPPLGLNLSILGFTIDSARSGQTVRRLKSQRVGFWWTSEHERAGENSRYSGIPDEPEEIGAVA
jgi:hypothetical protein